MAKSKMFPIMGPSVSKFALTVHIASSVGWLGAAAGFLAHAIASMTLQDAHSIRAAYHVMELTGWFVLVPLSVASLITGLVQSFGTKWGLFRHYWVLAKFLLTVFATIILLAFMRGFAQLADAAAQNALSAVHTGGHGGAASPIVHASGGLIVLLGCLTLSVYKPWGRIGKGRKQTDLPGLGA